MTKSTAGLDGTTRSGQRSPRRAGSDKPERDQSKSQKGTVRGYYADHFVQSDRLSTLQLPVPSGSVQSSRRLAPFEAMMWTS